MIKLFFTRHGETAINVENKLQHHDHGEITEKGFKQIEKIGKELGKSKIDSIISSDSPRCKITAQEINKKLNSEINYTHLLREKENGLWGGKKDSEVNWDSLEGNFETRKAPEGESLIDVRNRARRFLDEIIVKENEGKNILVVSHGAFLKVLIGELLGMDLKSAIFRLYIDHCSLTLVEFGEEYKEKYQIKYINKTLDLL